MPEITDSVGDGGANKKHDVALVEVMLRLIKDPKGNPYFSKNYDGKFTNDTKQAIRKYQTDKGLITPPTPPVGGAPSPTGGLGGIVGAIASAILAAGAEKLGLISKGGKTITQMVKDLPAAYANIRCLENTNLVFLEHSAADLSAAQTALGKASLEDNFRKAVVKLTDQFFAQHKLALSIAGKSGGLRSFQRQLELYEQGRTKPGDVVTWVGPGESNHQWARAVDYSPNEVKWLKGDTSTVTDDWWFNKLNKADSAKFNTFYDALIAARDAIALPLGMFRLKNSKGKLIDPPHLQSYDQSKVNMGRSLAALLNATGVGVCRWQALGGNYHTDYGIGGTTMFDAGSSVQIFSGNAVVTKDRIAKAHNEVAQAAAAGKAYKKLTAADIKSSEVTDIRKRLKADWVKAEGEWARWTPLP